MAASLPPARTPGVYRIAVVCLGNICRSPMADVVLTDRVADAGWADVVEIVSAGTAGWHIGKPMDRRAAASLTSHGYDATQHRAQQVDPRWLEDLDLVLAMDATNLQDLLDLAMDLPGADPSRVLPFRAFDPLADRDLDVPDPYYGADDGFEHVLRLVTRTATHLVDRLGEVLDRPADSPS